MKAYAKVNLSLNILEELPDGYHTISTVMQSVDLSDELEFIVSKKRLVVRCDDRLIPSGKDNLVYKAADILRKKANIAAGATIIITKRIPAGGGLGGGSADAACALMHLNKMWNINMTFDDLSKLASEIGMDVPFFIYGGTAHCTGKGEIIAPVASPSQFDIVIAKPGIHVSTKEAYAEAGCNPLGLETKRCLEAIDENNIKKIADTLHNDFERSVIKKHPKIQTIKDICLANGALGTVMSGSGSSVFCICEDAATAIRISKTLLEKGIWARACKSRTEH